MTKEEEARIDRIDELLIETFRKRNECIKNDQVEIAEALTEALYRLDREKNDIMNGYKSIMDERKEELLNKVDELNNEFINAKFLKKRKLKKEINEIYFDLQEYRLRNYAKAKVKKKTLDK